MNRPNKYTEKANYNQVSKIKPASTSPAHFTRKTYLPPKKNNLHYTLVLDLDETLVHYEPAERKFKIRPHCLSFLKNMSQVFEVVIFTAAS